VRVVQGAPFFPTTYARLSGDQSATVPEFVPTRYEWRVASGPEGSSVASGSGRCGACTHFGINYARLAAVTAKGAWARFQ